jgi:hypothetical protein
LQPIAAENARPQTTYHSQSQAEANPFAAGVTSQALSSRHTIALHSPYDPKASLVDDDDHDFSDPSGGINPPSYVDHHVHVQRSNSNVKRGEAWEMVTNPPEILLTPTSSSYRVAGPHVLGIGISLDTTIPIAGPSHQRHELHPILMNYVRVTLFIARRYWKLMTNRAPGFTTIILFSLRPSVSLSYSNYKPLSLRLNTHSNSRRH